MNTYWIYVSDEGRFRLHEETRMEEPTSLYYQNVIVDPRRPIPSERDYYLLYTGPAYRKRIYYPVMYKAQSSMLLRIFSVASRFLDYKYDSGEALSDVEIELEQSLKDYAREVLKEFSDVYGLNLD